MSPDDRPSVAEATMAAVAGGAFAGSAVFLRGATLVPAAVFDGVALALVAFGLAPALSRATTRAAATLLRGAGLAAGALLASTALVPPFDRTALPLALWVLGGTLLQAEARLRRRGAWLALVGAVVAVGGTGVAFVFADGLPAPQRFRVVVVGATAVAAAALLAREWALRQTWAALAPRPVGILLVCALSAAYVGYRASVATRVENLPLYEWTLGVGVATLVLARLRRGVRETATPEAWSSDARRHAQDVGPVYDERMAPLAAAVQRYLDTGAGFDEYRVVMRRALAEGPARARLEALRPSPGRSGRAARYAAHEELIPEAPHGHPQPRLRAHP